MKTFNHTYDVTLPDIDRQFSLPINTVQGIFTDAIGRYMGTEGIGPDDLVRNGRAWILTDFSSSLGRRMPLWKETFSVETWIGEVSSLRVFTDYRMTDRDGAVLAAGTGTWTVLDMESRRPVPCESMDGLGRLFDPDDEVHHRPYRYTAKGAVIAECRHKITMTETDFNGHLNNQSYVKIAISMAPSEFMAGHAVKDFHIRFGHECFLGDELLCSLEKVDEGNYVSVLRRADDGAEACRMESLWEEKGK